MHRRTQEITNHIRAFRSAELRLMLRSLSAGFVLAGAVFAGGCRQYAVHRPDRPQKLQAMRIQKLERQVETMRMTNGDRDDAIFNLVYHELMEVMDMEELFEHGKAMEAKRAVPDKAPGGMHKLGDTKVYQIDEMRR